MGVELPLGEPLGFPRCKKCQYMPNGPSAVCFECAQSAVQAVAAGSCPVCSQLMNNGRCGSPVCSWGDRAIARISAVAMYSGTLRSRILSFKKDGMTGWARIFGRLLYEHILRNASLMADPIVVPNPTFVGKDSSSVIHHTEMVVEAAEREDVHGLFDWASDDPPVVEKVGPTPPSTSQGWHGKKEAADALPGVLRINQPHRIAGRDVIIYDDVCTTALQLNAMAGFLLEEGEAASVEAVVLARTPYRAG